MRIKYRLDEINGMDKDDFIAVFGNVFEDSPWVAETAWQSMPYKNRQALIETLCDVVRNAGRERQLALLRGAPGVGRQKAFNGTFGTRAEGWPV